MAAAWEYALVNNIPANGIPCGDWKRATDSMKKQISNGFPRELLANGAVTNGAYQNATYKFKKKSEEDGMAIYSHIHVEKTGYFDIAIRGVSSSTVLLKFEVLMKGDDVWSGRVSRALSGAVLFDIEFNAEVTMIQLLKQCRGELCQANVCTMQVDVKIVRLCEMPANCKVKKFYSGLITDTEEAFEARDTKRQRVQ